MARPREFDEDEVLDRALTLFWERGYDSASLAELEEATGLSRPSIYAAFGDKEGLFLRALQRYQTRYQNFSDLLEGGPTVRAGFERLLDAWFCATAASSGPKGCMVHLASLSSAIELPAVQSLVVASGKNMEQIFRKALERAQASGELVPGGSPALLARYFSVGIQGLSSSARSGATRRELKPVADLLLATLFGPQA
jgi:AcrR family transcriptional regulator